MFGPISRHMMSDAVVTDETRTLASSTLDPPPIWHWRQIPLALWTLGVPIR